MMTDGVENAVIAELPRRTPVVEVTEDPNPRTWMSVVGLDRGFVGLHCLTHGQFWSNDYAPWSEMCGAVEHHVSTRH